MINVIIVAGAVPTRPTVLVEALEEFRAKGAEVSVACFFDPAELAVHAGLAELHSLPAAAKGHGQRFRRAVKRAESPRRIWLHAQHDPWVRQRARRADVLVALDQRAIHTVWQLAQRHRGADAVYGLAPALTAVAARQADPRRYALRRALRPAPSPLLLVSGTRRWSGETARAVVNRAVGRRVMRTDAGRGFWRATVAAPGIPDGARVKLVERVHTSMVSAGEPADAERAMLGAGKRVQDAVVRADLLGRVATAELARGDIPACLGDAADAELVVADATYQRGEIKKSSGALMRAIRLLFHRIVHFDGSSSPLMDDPAGYLGTLRRSAVGTALAAPRGRSAAAARVPAGRPRRLLFVTRVNDNFLREIRQRYTDLPDTEVRYLDLAADPQLDPLTHHLRRLIEDVLTGGSDYRDELERLLRPHLDWADTVFVDWCVIQAAVLTLLDPGQTRIVVRLHSFEAFTVWPHVVDFSRVDDLVFVSEHLRDLTVAVAPQLTGPDAPRTHVISNAMDLRGYPRDKAAPARFTLGLVGIGSVAKDPRWAVRVLRLLRERDPRYRLALIGAELDPELGPAVRSYRDALERDIAELDAPDAVLRTGQTDDVPAALVDVGVILSTSVRESFHCALLEGTASGAVPVVRNWPFFAGRPHGAHTLFPADWVVDTPEQAAERILKLTATEDTWREAARAASAYAIDTWDWSVTQQEMDRLLLTDP